MPKPAFTVKAYKHPRLKFVARGKVAGKWDRKYFRTRGEAETFAQQRNTELLNQGLEALDVPSWLRIMAQRCQSQLDGYGKTLEDAVNFYLPHLQATNRSCVISSLVKELLEIKKRDGASSRYLGDLRSRLSQFADKFDKILVADMTATQVDQWLRSLKVSPTTRNNFRRVLIVAFNFALDRGYCTSNPAKKSAKAKEIEIAVGILTVEQTATLLTAATTELVPYIALGAFAGLRRAELERLDWSEIDFQSGLIQVTAAKAKSARRRFVKIQPNLAAWLTPLKRLHGQVTPNTYREQLDEARQQAGIENWPQNALRHGFASYHLANFNDAAALALEMGHTNSNLVFKHYRELVKPIEAARYWNIKPSQEAEKVVAFAAK
jgi:integrase